MVISQAFAVVRFLIQYAIHVSVFGYCYARIFHTIRRQGKVVAGHVGRSQDVPMATTSRDPNAGHIHQQGSGATTGAKLSHTELNAVKTIICVIACFMIFWTVPAFTNFLKPFGVCITMWMCTLHTNRHRPKTECRNRHSSITFDLTCSSEEVSVNLQFRASYFKLKQKACSSSANRAKPL